MQHEKPRPEHAVLFQEAHHGFVYGSDVGFQTLARLCLCIEGVDVCGVFLRDSSKQCFTLKGFADRRTFSSDSTKSDEANKTLEQGSMIPKHLSIHSLENVFEQGCPLSERGVLSAMKDPDLSKLCEALSLHEGLLFCIENRPQACGFVFWGSKQIEHFSSDVLDVGVLLARELRDHFARYCLEQGLHETSLLFAQTQRITHSGLWRLFLPSGRVFWTEEVYHIHEVQPENYAPSLLPDLDFYPPKSRELLETALRRCAESGESYDLDLEFVTAKGKKTWVRARGTRTHYDEEEIHIAGTFQDIHEQKLAQEAIQQSETRLRTYFEKSVIGIALTDPFGTIHDANPYLCSLLGYPKEDICGMEWHSFCPTAEEEARCAFSKLLNTPTDALSHEFTVQCKDGTFRNVRADTVVMRQKSGDIDHILMYVTDLTTQRQLEAERQQLDEQMQHAAHLESLAILAGGIAHDFNNLLVGILGNAGLASLELDEENTARCYLEKIEHAAERAADLTRQMLAYAGQGHLFHESLSLSDLVSEMTHLLESSISKKARIRIETQKEIPPITADRTQLQQIIMNLLINASDALEGKDGEIFVRTGLSRMDEAKLRQVFLGSEAEPGYFAYLEVADDGCGIAPEIQRRIFDPFFTTKKQGHGLGLAAVLGIVRTHKGYLSLQSSPGKGTVFRVGFSVKEQSTAAQRYKSSPQIQRSTRTHGVALVADDEGLVRDVIQRLLEHQGFQVYTAQDGFEALRMYEKYKETLSIFLLDLSMPGFSGVEVLKKVRESDKKTPILLMSGFHDTNAILQSEKNTGFLPKPFRGVQLFERLNKLLQPAFHASPQKTTTSAVSP